MADDEAMRQFLEGEAPTGPPTRDPDVEWVQAPDGSWQQLDPRIKAERDQRARQAPAAATHAEAVAAAGRDGNRNFLIVCGILVAIFLALAVGRSLQDQPSAAPPVTRVPSTVRAVTTVPPRPATTRAPSTTVAITEAPPTTPFVPVQTPAMSMAEFNQIQPGQSYDYVVSIVGGPGELSTQTVFGDYTGSIYTWNGVGGIGANAIVQFQNGLVIGKSQIGLE